MNTTQDDGGPFPVDSSKEIGILPACEKFTFQPAVLPSFLIPITHASLASDGDWEQTVTFTAGAQTLRDVVACFIDSSLEQNPERKFIIAMAISWTTDDAILKEQRRQITKNTTILQRWLRETGQAESIPSEVFAKLVGKVSLRIQTIEAVRNAVGSFAPSDLPLKGGLRSWVSAIPAIPKAEAALRDWFAGMALQGFAAQSGAYDSTGAASDAYRWADAMLAARKEAK